jgi:hypothetical protein
MEKCPTCGARWAGKEVCHRCKTDLGSLLDIEHQAARHHEAGMGAFKKGDFEQMYYHAERSWSLRRTPESRGFLACASIMAGKYREAVSLWRSGQ